MYSSLEHCFKIRNPTPDRIETVQRWCVEHLCLFIIIILLNYSAFPFYHNFDFSLFFKVLNNLIGSCVNSAFLSEMLPFSCNNYDRFSTVSRIATLANTFNRDANFNTFKDQLRITLCSCLYFPYVLQYLNGTFVIIIVKL